MHFGLSMEAAIRKVGRARRVVKVNGDFRHLLIQLEKDHQSSRPSGRIIKFQVRA